MSFSKWIQILKTASFRMRKIWKSMISKRMNNINSARHFHATKGNSSYQFLDANFDMYGYFERFLWRFAASYAYINFVWLFSSGFCPSGQTLTTQKVTFPIKDKREMYFIFYLLQQLAITKLVLLFVSVHTCIVLYFRCSWKWCTISLP